jgi:hypothetical protein
MSWIAQQRLSENTTPRQPETVQSNEMIPHCYEREERRDNKVAVRSERKRWQQRLGVWVICLASAGLACAPLLTGQSPAKRSTAAQSGKKTPPQPAKRAAVAEAVVPFKDMEQLSFQALFSKFTVKAAEMQFRIAEHREFFGRTAWHFRATAQTVDTVRLLYPLDDQFDSYTDATRLTSIQYEMYLRESGQKQDNTWRMDTGEGAIPSGVSAARVLPGTRDPLGLLYALRAADWKVSPEFRAPVFEGRHLYDMQARLGETASQIKVPAGTFSASEIKVRVFERGRELTDTTFSLWLANNEEKTPVLIEATLPIGSARIELTSLR